ncbi:glycosyl hydrolase [Bacteroidia bacterium]|nr:glycosyl hydrolase [Bacteroidia bacterium]
MKERFVILFWIIISATNLSAQGLTHLWTGLRDLQSPVGLPKGNAPFQQAQRVPKVEVSSQLISVEGGEYILNDGWELIDGTSVIESGKSVFDQQLNTNNWYNATVPGTILTTLVNQGVYPDPYYGLNNLVIPDTLSRMDWWYRKSFGLTGLKDGEQMYLVFEGINYFAEIFLNGRKLGNMKGAFIRGEFDITGFVHRDGKENVLAVHIYPPSNPGIPHEQSIIAGQGLNGGMLSLDGPTFISSIGWDWIPGIRDRNTGIWQDVKLKIGGGVFIGDAMVITDLDLPDTTVARIKISVPVRNNTDKLVRGLLTAKVEKHVVRQSYSLLPNEEKTVVYDPKQFAELNIRNPRLWWPNGYGNQELYHLVLEVTSSNVISDTKEVRFGIREMSYELMVQTPEKKNIRYEYSPVNTVNPGIPVFNYEKRAFFTKDNQLPTLNENADLSGLKEIAQDDPVGPFLVIKVNGVRIFCRGGNWGMDDGMKRVSRERLEPYFKLHKNANFNIIRNWTGESTEEVFYALCDEYGLLVWNDFWITTDDTVEPNDFRLFIKNVKDVVRRFRNHPSIAVWCPRNEGFAPEGLSLMLSEMMAKEDPSRHYHGQSRFLNMGTSGPWGYFKDPSLYYTRNAKGFNTELGTFAIPTANTIRKFIAPEDQWPINDVWAYHDLHHTSQNFKDFMDAVDRYGKPENMEDFSRKAQLVTYDAWRNILEAWNSRMWNNTSGLILWMSHPAWPSMIWQTYTYDYETPGSYFGAKKACEPLHVQKNLPDNDVVIINSTLNEYKSLAVTVKYVDVHGKILYRKEGKFNAGANTLTSCFDKLNPGNLPVLYLVRLELKDNKGHVLSINDYWETNGSDKSYEEFNKLSKVGVQVKAKELKDKIQVELSNPSQTIVAGIKLNVVDKATGEIILPAYFSDGYINLLGREKRVLELAPAGKAFSNYEVVATQY